MKEIIKKNNAFFRQLIFLAVLITVGLIITKQLFFFLGSFLGAITIYVVLRNVMFRLNEKYHWKKWAASLVLVFATAAVLVVMGYFCVKAIAMEIPMLDSKAIYADLQELVGKIDDKLGVTIIPINFMEESQTVIAKVVTSVINTTYSFGVNIFMTLVILYFMLAGGRAMERKMWEYAPFIEGSLCLLKKEAKNMIYSNAVGIPVVLVIQTIAAGLIYWMLGVSSFLFWGFLTALCGLIPIMGTAIVYIPFAIYMVAVGDVWQGIVLAAYGILVISNLDNVFRIMLMRKVADTHPLIVIFGVILGIPLFGFWGIIFGPLFISGFILLIKIYYVEYGLIEPPSEEEMCKPPVKRGPKHIHKLSCKANDYSQRRNEQRARKREAKQG